MGIVITYIYQKGKNVDCVEFCVIIKYPSKITTRCFNLMESLTAVCVYCCVCVCVCVCVAKCLQVHRYIYIYLLYIYTVNMCAAQWGQSILAGVG